MTLEKNTHYFTSNIPTLPGSLMVVCGVGHSRESHGSLWGWALRIVCEVGHSWQSHGSL